MKNSCAEHRSWVHCRLISTRCRRRPARRKVPVQHTHIVENTHQHTHPTNQTIIKPQSSCDASATRSSLLSRSFSVRTESRSTGKETHSTTRHSRSRSTSSFPKTTLIHSHALPPACTAPRPRRGCQPQISPIREAQDVGPDARVDQDQLPVGVAVDSRIEHAGNSLVEDPARDRLGLEVAVLDERDVGVPGDDEGCRDVLGLAEGRDQLEESESTVLRLK